MTGLLHISTVKHRAIQLQRPSPVAGHAIVQLRPEQPGSSRAQMAPEPRPCTYQEPLPYLPVSVCSSQGQVQVISWYRSLSNTLLLPAPCAKLRQVIQRTLYKTRDKLILCLNSLSGPGARCLCFSGRSLWLDGILVVLALSTIGLKLCGGIRLNSLSGPGA